MSTSMSSASPTYRLLYFNLRGAAEPIRYMLALCRVPYHDIRYPMAASERGFGLNATFLKHKEEGAFDANMGQLPILQVLQDSVVQIEIGQSHSIMRFLASRHGLFGKNEWEHAKIDVIYECVRDIKSKWFKAKGLSRKRQFIEEDLVTECSKLEKIMAHSDYVWLVGDQVSLADVAVYSMLSSSVSLMTGSADNFFDGADSQLLQNSYQTCPRMKASIQEVAKLGEIREWEERRPDSFG
jgi:prostaglandin-H2 D-isomerase / glutathione transferase